VNSSLELLKVAMKQRGLTGPINPVAEEMCKIIDHFNEQHWRDRNAYNERIKTLEAILVPLEKASAPT
jgi:hypothetical protein